MLWYVRPLLIVLAVAAGSPQPTFAAEEFSPVTLLSAMIMQLQEGRLDPSLYGEQLFRTIAEQTNNSGRYGQLAVLGPVTQINLMQAQEYPSGRVYYLQAHHANGVSVWNLGVNSMSQRIEYANFNVVSALQTQGAPQPQSSMDRLRNSNQPNMGCKLYPALC